MRNSLENHPSSSTLKHRAEAREPRGVEGEGRRAGDGERSILKHSWGQLELPRPRAGGQAGGLETRRDCSAAVLRIPGAQARVAS